MAKSGIRARMPKSDDSVGVSAAARFGKYKGEEESCTKAPSVRANLEHEKLRELWKGYAGLFRAFRCKSDDGLSWEEMLGDMYRLSSLIIEGRRFSARTVGRFSAAFCEHQEGDYDAPVHAAGIFFSALVNLGTASSYRLETTEIDPPLNGLGYLNSKYVTISGDAGHTIGTGMKSGKVVVHGNAAWPIGKDMEGGIIVIDGDARQIDCAGDYTYAGRDMKGGEIHINGEFFFGGRKYEDWREELETRVRHGRIFHKGKVIVDK